MKRTPLDRGDKPLLRRTPLAQTAPIARKVPQQRATRMARPRKARDTGPAITVKQLVDARDTPKGENFPRCLRCGGKATNRQHRQGRGSGGRGQAEADRTNGCAWLASICGMGNTSGCHKAIDEDPRSVETGWIIRRNGVQRPAEEVPLLCYDGWWLLTTDGERVPCDEPEGWAA